VKGHGERQPRGVPQHRHIFDKAAESCFLPFRAESFLVTVIDLDKAQCCPSLSSYVGDLTGCGAAVQDEVMFLLVRPSVFKVVAGDTPKNETSVIHSIV
jgi:hypothetical protein